MKRQTELLFASLVLAAIGMVALGTGFAKEQVATSRSTPASDDELDAFLQQVEPEKAQPQVATATSAPRGDRHPEAIFFSAISQLRDVLTPQTRQQLAGNDQRQQDEAVRNLKTAIDQLFEAGKNLQAHERRLGREPSKSPFLISDADYGEMGNAFARYRDAQSAADRAVAIQNLQQLMREASENFEKNWPYNIGVVNASQIAGRRVTEGASAQSPVANEVPMDETQAATNRRRSGPRETAIVRAIRAVSEAKNRTAKAAATKELVNLLDRLVSDAGEASRRAGVTDPGARNLAVEIRERLLALDRAEGDVAKSEAELELREVVDRSLASRPELDPPRPGASARIWSAFNRQVMSSESGKDSLEAQIREAVEQFRSAEGEAKTAAQQKLKELLEQYVDRDLQRREAEVADVEGQVKKLREQLDRRLAKRRELIDLQMKLVENEAEGLGFFSSPAATQPNPPAIYDWFGRPIPPGGAQSMNPPAMRDWYGRPIEQPNEPPSGTNVPPATPRRDEPKSASLESKLDEDGRVPAFDLSGQNWPDVLAWYAKLANHRFEWQELPNGVVNIRTGRPTSLEEVRDLLKRGLLERGFVLMESDGVVRVVRILRNERQ
jgi:hypothetical protein